MKDKFNFKREYDLYVLRLMPLVKKNATQRGWYSRNRDNSRLPPLTAFRHDLRVCACLRESWNCFPEERNLVSPSLKSTQRREEQTTGKNRKNRLEIRDSTVANWEARRSEMFARQITVFKPANPVLMLTL